MTVSRVINNYSGVAPETRQRVLEVIEAIGYRVNSAARALNGNSKILGLIIPEITASYTAEILRGISRAAERFDYSLMLYSQGISPAEWAHRTPFYASLLTNGLAAGVVIVCSRDYEVLARTMQENYLPYILVDHQGDAVNEPSVTAMNRKGVLGAMRYLVALGHHRIGFITGDMTLACSRERLQGYQDGFAEFGIPFDPSLIRAGDFTQASGFHHGERLLLEENRPTAIIASSDSMAFGVMDAAKKHGFSIGQNLSLVGFDDVPMAAEVYPPLTTVHQPMCEMGEAALEMLINTLEGRRLSTARLELATELVIRESTGRNIA